MNEQREPVDPYWAAQQAQAARATRKRERSNALLVLGVLVLALAVVGLVDDTISPISVVFLLIGAGMFVGGLVIRP